MAKKIATMPMGESGRRLRDNSKLLGQLRAHHPSLKYVVDGRENVPIIVTARDVGKADRKNRGSCAISVAALRTQQVDNAIISSSRCYLVSNDVAYRYLLGNDSVRELTSFDRGASFTPGTYVMKAPAVSNQLGVGRPDHKATSSGKGGEIKRRVAINDIRAPLWDVT
jgi:hypothetical protein